MRVHIPCAVLGLIFVAACSTAAPAVAAAAMPTATAPPDRATGVVMPTPVADYGPPPYDAAPPPADGRAAAVGPAAGPGGPGPAYQYIYQSDRILVVDPVTGIAMQALPR